MTSITMIADGESLLESLAPEIIVLILLDLPVQDLCHLSQTSSYLHQCCQDWTVWAEKAHRDLGCPKDVFLEMKLVHPGSRYNQLEHYQTSQDDNVLIEVARQNDVELGRYLIQLKSHDRVRYWCGALNEAAKLGHCDFIQMMIDTGTQYVSDPLKIAIEHNQPRVVKLLVDFKNDMGDFNDSDFVSKYGENEYNNLGYFIYLAGMWGHPNIVEVLLDSVNVMLESTRWPKQIGLYCAIEGASTNGHVSLVQSLLLRITIDSTMDHELTVIYVNALNSASRNGHAKVVEALIQAKNQPLFRDHFDKALLIASKHGHCNVVKVLFAAGADRHNRALEKAAKHGHGDIVKVLLQNGAHNLESTLYLAVNCYRLNVIKELINHRVPTQEVLDEALDLAIKLDPPDDGIVWYLQRVISLLPSLRP